MSEVRQRVDLDELAGPICEFCGIQIEEPDQKCPALSEGVCSP